jgi:hypothetical protein
VRTVWKYPLALVADDQTIEMAVGSRIVHCEEQNRVPTMWAEADTAGAATDFEERRFVIVGTGHPIPDGFTIYRGACVLDEGAFVFHVYEWQERGSTNTDVMRGGPVP